MADWYIDPAGNDTTGDGSIGTPYLTISKCHSVGSGGDTVYCRGGTYTTESISSITEGADHHRLHRRNAGFRRSVVTVDHCGGGDD